MNLYDAMRTTFAARDYTDDPLDDATLHRILDNARFAPNGGNRQGWKVIVVRENATRRALADLVTDPVKRYMAQVRAGENPWNSVVPSSVDARTVEGTEVPPRMVAPLLRAPVVLIVCVDLRVVASMDKDLDRVGVTSGASIYPFVWNVLLAARAEGYGGVLTTFATAAEPELKPLLGLPEHIAVAAVLPLGKPVKQLTRLRREPVESFSMRERWDGESFRG